jgi:hypothetical protein
MDTMDLGWTDVRPERDEERFGVRSTERQAVFDKARNERSSMEVDQVLWAFLQFADLDYVKEMTSSDYAWESARDSVRVSAAMDVVRLWQQKPEAKNDGASTDAKSPAPRTHTTISNAKSRTRSGRTEGGHQASIGRSPVVAARCKERDGGLCAVSRTKGVEAVSKSLYEVYARQQLTSYTYL